MIPMTTAVHETVMEDPALPHQIVLRFDGRSMRVYVSCNCLKTSVNGYQKLACGVRLTAAAARAAWLAHMATIRENDHDEVPGAHLL